MSHQHEKINYVEYPACNLASTKQFFSDVFGWVFTDYGPDYTAFNHQGIEGGFYKSNLQSNADQGAALIVFYSDDLGDTYQKITSNGGAIKTEIFDFPGGKRFHFTCPSGNEFAVWSYA